MTSRSIHVILVILAAFAICGMGASLARAENSEVQTQTAVLASDADYMAKLHACQRLGEIGGDECVPALAPLLKDEQLCHPARIALEAIPGEAAVTALREALPHLEGKSRLGVIQSLGVRRDAKAVEPLRALLQDRDLATASAAASALGRIATDPACDALRENLASAEAGVRAAIGDALLHAGEVRAAAGETAQAVKLYGLVAAADVPRHIQLGAVRGLIVNRAPDATERFRQLLRGDDPGFYLALDVARVMSAAEVTLLVAAELSNCPPERQALLLTLLGDLGDASALPKVVEAARSGEQPVRVAALAALGTLGDVSTLPLLLDAAGEGDPAVAKAANESLTWLRGPQVDAEIARQLLQDQTMSPARRRLLIELAGRRRIEQAIPALLSAADASDNSLRLAAIQALGQTLPANQLEPLTKRLLNPQSPEELAAIQAALRIACIRTADRETAAQQLVECLPKASPEVKAFLLDLLGDVGGKTALEAVAAAALQPELQDLATRVLGEWMTPDAGPALLAVVRQSSDQRFRIRALRGYVRIARQFDVPDEQRVAMYGQALQLAERPEERVLVLESLTRVATPAALELARSQLAVEGLTDQAAAAAVAIGEQIASQSPEAVAQAMAAVLQATKNPEILARARRLTEQVTPR